MTAAVAILCAILTPNQREITFIVLTGAQVLTLVVVTVIAYYAIRTMRDARDFVHISKHHQAIATSEAAHAKRVVDVAVKTADAAVAAKKVVDLVAEAAAKSGEVKRLEG